MLRIVLLPQPEGPTIDTNSPASTEKLTLSDRRHPLEPLP